MEEASDPKYLKALEKAYELINRRMHSTHEIRQKLSVRGFDIEVIKMVISRLLELGLLNDDEFAKVYIESMIRYKTYGYYLMLKKLFARGIDKHMALEALDLMFSYEAEKKLARNFLSKQKKLGRVQAYQKLKMRGFRNQAISGLC